MSDSFSNYIEQCQRRTHDALIREQGGIQSEFSAHAEQYLPRLQQALSYALTNGGKRVRPILVFASAEAIGGQPSSRADLDKIAVAIEMVHSYSLVHDDLPAMDDDDLRRGNPTCHIQFDEATAILTGDALQARAFELLTELQGCSPSTALQLVATLAAAAGPRGMVGGQAIDLAAMDREIDQQHLQTMHQLKTGALIRGAIKLGALYSGATAHQLQQLDTYGTAIGLSFQVQDDILDIESDTATLGKRQGADLSLNKPTYPKLLGMEGAKQFAQQLHQQALDALTDFGEPAHRLRELSHYIISRRH